MKNRLILILFGLITVPALSQHEYQLWTSVGADGTLIKKKLDWAAEMDFRFGDRGLNTFFPQIGLEYTVLKWMKPSVEYRYIIEKNKIGNYKGSNRLNFNLNFNKSINRFSFGFRARYQYSFNQITNSGYNADFDQAFRFKPSIEYDIKNSIFSPKVSSEFFYNPQYGPDGPRFTKVRIGIGSSLELDGPHRFSFKYQLDLPFHDPTKDLRHALVLEYTYKF